MRGCDNWKMMFTIEIMMKHPTIGKTLFSIVKTSKRAQIEYNRNNLVYDRSNAIYTRKLLCIRDNRDIVIYKRNNVIYNRDSVYFFTIGIIAFTIANIIILAIIIHMNYHAYNCYYDFCFESVTIIHMINHV